MSESYKYQTEQNTRTEWLDEGRVEVDLAGMSDYAQGMIDLQFYTVDHMTRVLQDLATVPQQAWEAWPPPLPEGRYVADKVTKNAGEFAAYLQALLRGITNVGMAAQTIADIYRGTDGFGAASLASVQWAFDQYGATRPANAPSWIRDQTAEEKYREDATGAPPATDSPLWTQSSEEPMPGGGTRVVWTAPNGSRMVVELVAPYSGVQVRTTTIYDPSGAQLAVRTETTSVTVYSDGRVLTTVNTATNTPNGTSQNSVVTEQAHKDGALVTTVTQKDGDETTGLVVTTTDTSGTTVATYGTDDDGNFDPDNPTRVVAIGADPTSDHPTDPVETATDELADPYGENELEQRAERPQL